VCIFSFFPSLQLHPQLEDIPPERIWNADESALYLNPEFGNVVSSNRSRSAAEDYSCRGFQQSGAKDRVTCLVSFVLLIYQWQYLSKTIFASFYGSAVSLFVALMLCESDYS
jgi:hypothetical protein